MGYYKTNYYIIKIKKTRYHYGKLPIGRLQFITSVGIDQTIRVHIPTHYSDNVFYLLYYICSSSSTRRIIQVFKYILSKYIII